MKQRIFRSMTATLLAGTLAALLVACATGASAGPGSSKADSSSAVDSSTSASASSAISRPAPNSSQSAGSRAAPSSQSESRSESASQGSTSGGGTVQGGGPSSPQIPASSPPPQTPAPTTPEPTPDPAPAPPAPPPVETVDVTALMAEAHSYAASKGTTLEGAPVMAVNGGLTTGNAGYFNPPDVSVQTYASALSDLKWCIDKIWGMLQTAPDFSTDTSYPIYNIVQEGSRIYVLYG